MSKYKKNRSHPVGFWEMVRDVLIASMAKGQFPLAMVAAIMLFAIWRMPTADVSKFAFGVLEEVRNLHLIGEIMTILLAGAWYFHARFQRKFHMDEINRITNERNKLQAGKAGVKIKSSSRQE